MFELSGGSAPLYQQLADDIKKAIRDGRYRAGDRLPPVRAVAKSLTLNPNTVAHAYQELEHQGVISTTVGRGSFVLDPGDPLMALHDTVLKVLTDLRKAGWSRIEIQDWCLKIIRSLDDRKDYRHDD